MAGPARVPHLGPEGEAVGALLQRLQGRSLDQVVGAEAVSGLVVGRRADRGDALLVKVLLLRRGARCRKGECLNIQNSTKQFGGRSASIEKL